MRIISLSPAGTEWLAAVGRLDSLVGRSPQCDYPPTVLDVPVLPGSLREAVTHERLRTSGPAADDLGKGALERLEALVDLRPDVIVIDGSPEDAAALRHRLSVQIPERTLLEVFAFHPQRFKEILETALRLGRSVGAMASTMRWIGEAEARLRRVSERIAAAQAAEIGPRRAVLCLDGTEPLQVPGLWTADIITHAGGVAVLTSQGKPPQRISIADAAEADPDIVAILMDHEPEAPLAGELAKHVRRRPEWGRLRAVRDGNVFALDGRLFRRPGPRIYRGVELMAFLCHPDVLHAGDLRTREFTRVTVGPGAEE